MNRGYLLKDKVGLKPSMLVCIDMKTHLEQFYDFTIVLMIYQHFIIGG